MQKTTIATSNTQSGIIELIKQFCYKSTPVKLVETQPNWFEIIGISPITNLRVEKKAKRYKLIHIGN